MSTMETEVKDQRQEIAEMSRIYNSWRQEYNIQEEKLSMSLQFQQIFDAFVSLGSSAKEKIKEKDEKIKEKDEKIN